jgi:hypothetical protein
MGRGYGWPVAGSRPDHPGVLVRWLSGDPNGLVRRIGALGLEASREATRIAFPSAVLEIAALDDAGALTSNDHDRLELNRGPTPEFQDRPEMPPGRDLLAIGWATVDLERAASAFTEMAIEAVASDDLLGARASVAAPPTGPRIVFLEPVTEGRLAAFLARRGEGPAALYLIVPVSKDVRAVLSLSGSGPFGPQSLVRGGLRDGPYLLVVEPDALTAPSG